MPDGARVSRRDRAAPRPALVFHVEHPRGNARLQKQRDPLRYHVRETNPKGALMNQPELNAKVDSYLQEHWEEMVADIRMLVSIPSTEDLSQAAPGAPWGPGPRAALDAVLDRAAEMGLTTHDVDGYLGFADLPGASETQIGIIGHMDVVPAGPGWTFEPFDVTRKDGYLIGRGTIDDKGPSVVALHAVKFWAEQAAEQGRPLPYTIRFLFGANEETGMGDVAYYQKHYADPAFLFTPDADFPVGYGEKGNYNGLLTSANIPPDEAVVMEFEGGMAVNAVPGVAHAVVRADACALPATERIAVSPAGPGLARLDALGKGAHASTPEDGVNAIGLIVDYLLEHDLCCPAERAFLELDQRLLSCTDGSGLGIACEDDDFGALTAIGGTITLQDGRLRQTMDSRFPTTITADEITARVASLAESVGCAFECTRVMPTFLVDPRSPVIQALLDAYNEATGENARPFTMGGGTYARHFACAASFGPEKPWEEKPDWVGEMHGPDEGASEALLQQAFRIYALTIGKLMRLDLE